MKNVTKKLADARVKLQSTKLKKSGLNKFAKFEYYELADFISEVNKINKELGILSMFSFDKETAKLDIIDTESSEVITFSIPVIQAEMKGNNPIQELGATSTYLRRYLYLIAYEIQENDTVDALPVGDNKKEVVYATAPTIKLFVDLCKEYSINYKDVLKKYEKSKLEEFTEEEMLKMIDGIQKKYKK
jgi:hypothetical protein